MKCYLKILTIVLIILISSFTTVLVFASDDEEMNQKMLYDQTEYELVKDAIIDEFYEFEKAKIAEGQEISNASIQYGYKLYSLETPDFINEISKGSDLKDLISSDYVWVLSSSTDTTVKVNNNEDKWTVIGFKTPVRGKTDDDLIDFNQILALLEEVKINSEVSKDSVLCFEASMYHTSFVYIPTSKKVFLIPYGSRPDLTGLENGKLYDVQEVAEILDKAFATNHEADSGLVVNLDKPDSFSVGFIILGVFIVLIVTFGVVFISLKGKKFRESN